MSQAFVLSESTQSRIVEQAQADAASSTRRMKKSLLWAAGGIALAVAATVAFPASAIAGGVALVGSVTGLIGGLYATSELANKLSLRNIKEDVKKDSFVERMKKRASRLSKVYKISDKVSDYGLWGALGMMAVALLAPPVAAIAWTGYSAAIYTMAAGTFVRALVRDSKDTSVKLNGIAQATAPQDSLKDLLKPSNENAKPSGLSNAPSPSAAFDSAANDSAPVAAEGTQPKKAIALKP